MFSQLLAGCKKFEWEGDFEPDGKKRARKNVKEGKGITGPGGLFGFLVIKEEEEVLNLLHRMNYGEQA